MHPDGDIPEATPPASDAMALVACLLDEALLTRAKEAMLLPEASGESAFHAPPGRYVPER